LLTSKTCIRCVSVAASLLLTSLTVFADGSSGSGAVSIADGAPIVQDFDTLSNTTSPSNLLPAGWYVTELGTGSAADGSYVVGNGSLTNGGAYSFGATGSTDRAIGSIGSGTVTQIIYGAKFTNNAPGKITALAISFHGEMWRRGDASTDGLTFSYSSTASGLTSGAFTLFPALDFNSPGNACSAITGAATNGNGGECSVLVSATITGLSLNPGASIFISWTDANSGGSDDGLAIDDVSVTATISAEPTPPTATGSASPNPASPGQITNLSGTIISGFNPLSQSFTVSCDLSSIGGSSSQSLPVSGQTFTYDAAVGASTPLGSYSLPCSVSDDLKRSSNFAIALTVLLPLNSTCGAPATPVSAIQGSGLTSPLVSQTVDVEGIVAASFQGSPWLSGFYVEEPPAEQDGNPATSEGMFVFSSTAVNEGDRVRVRGNVAEFTSSTGSLVSSLTELSSVTSVQVCNSGNTLPPPVDVTLPVDNTSGWERYEGMLVRFNQQLVVTGTFNLGQFGQIDLAPGVLYEPTQLAGNSTSWAAGFRLMTGAPRPASI
jgi:hypothetical protein